MPSTPRSNSKRRKREIASEDFARTSSSRPGRHLSRSSSLRRFLSENPESFSDGSALLRFHLFASENPGAFHRSISQSLPNLQLAARCTAFSTASTRCVGSVRSVPFGLSITARKRRSPRLNGQRKSQDCWSKLQIPSASSVNAFSEYSYFPICETRRRPLLIEACSL